MFKINLALFIILLSSFNSIQSSVQIFNQANKKVLVRIENEQILYACKIDSSLLKQIFIDKEKVFFLDLNTVEKIKNKITLSDWTVVPGKVPSAILFHADQIDTDLAIPQDILEADSKEWEGEDVPTCEARGSTEKPVGMIYVENYGKEQPEIPKSKLTGDVERVIL